MAAAMSAAGASSDRPPRTAARSASHHAAAAATPTPACAVACSAPEDTEPNGPKANAAAVSAPTVIDRVTTRPKRYPEAAEVAMPRRRATLSCPMGETPNQRRGSSGTAIPSSESE